MRIRIVPSAQRQIRDAIAWWDANRPGAPGAIAEELRRTLRLLRVHTELGARARNPGMESIRRVLLARVRYHVYYRVIEGTGTIEVLAFWHAQRGSGPR